MADYISRNAAITAVKVHCPAKYETAVLARIVCVPAADVAEVRHGHWVAYMESRWIYAQCSCCGSVHDVKSNYCPTCGAVMDESEFAKDTNVLGKNESEEGENNV